MDLSRRGFLKLLAGAAVAGCTPAIAREAFYDAALNAKPAALPVAIAPVFSGLIRSLSVSFQRMMVEVESWQADHAIVVPTAHACFLDVEMYFDPSAPPPAPGESVGREWFDAHGIRKIAGDEVATWWPDDLKFYVTERIVECHPCEPLIARLRMAEVR